MSRLRTRNPPAPIGERTLTVYDAMTWAEAEEGASEWQIDLGLYVEYALRLYSRRRHSIKRFQRWRHEQDMKDPANRAIHDYLQEFDPQPEPEYMKDEYLPKSKRGMQAKAKARVKR